jgi:hypothetical protein
VRRPGVDDNQFLAQPGRYACQVALVGGELDVVKGGEPSRAQPEFRSLGTQ